MLNISFALSLDSIDCLTFHVHTYILTPKYPRAYFADNLDWKYQLSKTGWGRGFLGLFLLLKKYNELKYKSDSRVAIRMCLQFTQSNFYRLGINLLPYKFYWHKEFIFTVFKTPPPLFLSVFLPDFYLILQIIIIFFLLSFSICACASKIFVGQKEVKMY